MGYVHPSPCSLSLAPTPSLPLSLSPHSLALSHCLSLSPSLLLSRLTRFAWNTRFFAGIGIACITRSCLPPRTFRPSLVASPRRRAVSPAALCLAKTAWSPFPVRSLGVCPGVLRIPLRYLLPPSSSSSFFFLFFFARELGRESGSATHHFSARVTGSAYSSTPSFRRFLGEDGSRAIPSRRRSNSSLGVGAERHRKTIPTRRRSKSSLGVGAERHLQAIPIRRRSYSSLGVGAERHLPAIPTKRQSNSSLSVYAERHLEAISTKRQSNSSLGVGTEE